MTAEPMAALIGLPASTFRQYVREGLLPPGIKIGRHRLWQRDVVIAALVGLGGGRYDSANDNAEAAKGHSQEAERERQGPVLLAPGSRDRERRKAGATAGRSPFAGILGCT
jgi:hypothetical protein